MIDGVVDAEVAVVNTVVLLHVDRLVLGVVLREVERKLLFDLLGVDGGRHLGLTLVEHRQHGIVYIVVEEDDALLGRADEVGNKGVSIENLTVEEDAFHGRQRGSDKEVYLLLCLGNTLLQSLNAIVDSITFQQLILQDAVGPLAIFHTSI